MGKKKEVKEVKPINERMSYKQLKKYAEELKENNGLILLQA